MEWRPVVGFEGKYEVSRCGRIRNAKSEKVLSMAINTCGYDCPTLYKDGKKYAVRAHRAVIKAFLGDIPEHLEVNHKNGIKTDNRLENLELITHKENLFHKYRVLKQRMVPFLCTNIETGCVTVFESLRFVPKDKFTHSAISRVLAGKRRSHRGHTFSYLNK